MFKILNSYENGTDENTRSFSFKMEYNGFVFVLVGDSHAIDQRNIAHHFPDDVKADVHFANHHFHGSIDVDYLRQVDPALYLPQAQEEVYARHAYMVDFKLNHRRNCRNQIIEELFALETGTVVLRVNGKSDWSYETCRDTKTAQIPLSK